jgi:HAD superfamily hydrolase (TIGR01490 family)
MKAEKNPIAFFDVDKTLCDCYSGFHTTLELIRRKIIKKRRLLKALFYNAIGRSHLKANVRQMYDIAIADMAGTHIDDILKIGKETFEKHVRPKLFVEGLEEIKTLKKQGYLIALLTSGPYMLIKNMENYLQTDASFSNGPVIENGILQNRFREPLCYKEGKIQVAQEFADQQGVSLKECRFYSDSISDLPLLLKVGHPFTVNPDRLLRREAESRKWPILKFKETLKNQTLS